MIRVFSIVAIALGVVAFAAGGPASAGPVDTDGDGCTDATEMTTMFDYLDPWDFFDPSHDGLHRVVDIILVMQEYGIDSDEGGYTTTTDRSFDGLPAAPDGRVRSDDVLMVVDLYFVDCI